MVSMLERRIVNNADLELFLDVLNKAGHEHIVKGLQETGMLNTTHKLIKYDHNFELSFHPWQNVAGVRIAFEMFDFKHYK